MNKPDPSGVGFVSMLPALFLNSPKTSVSVPPVGVGPHTNAATINDLPEDVLASIFRVIHSGEDLCTKVGKWVAVNRQFNRLDNDFWVSVLEQPPFNWHHSGTLGVRNAGPMWDTGMTAVSFFQMLCGLTALQRNKILELTTTTTRIGDNAFLRANLRGLTSLPPGLTTIGGGAFADADLSGLTSLPPGLTTIENNAFQIANLSGLTSLPQGLTTIGDNAFQSANLRGLTSLPSGLRTIGGRAFGLANLSGLTSLPPGMTIESLQMYGADLSGLTALLGSRRFVMYG
jgi:hypothetical protein